MACIRPAAVLLACIAVAAPSTADAYIGPGAGFAVLGSFAVIFVTMLLAGASLLVWPFRMLWRAIRRRTKSKPLVKRLIVLGFDGQETTITERMMAEGELPNFQKLAASGCYSRLRSTFPSITPVAWSSFTTGTNPGKHNIFDFLDRDPRTYLPRLSSTEIGSVDKVLKLGKLRIPLAKPSIRLLRKSKPFWTVLGEHNIWSTIIRVPITFPPDKFYGAQLGAMCIPDLLGTQGTFLHFTTRPGGESFQEGGLQFELRANGSENSFEGTIEGPENSFFEGNPPMTLPLQIDVDRENGRALVSVNGDSLELEPMVLSEWVKLSFKAIAGMKVTGICRMMVTEMDEHVSLYVSPINIEPEKPAMPISHPGYYCSYLEKKLGSYATLGLAEDTWALNEKITDDHTFMTQTTDIDNEREQMLFTALDRLRKGTLVTVFDATDRINHMFWRYTEEGHPAAEGIEDPDYAHAIENQYRRNDEIVGKVMERLGEGDVLWVMSDHGCTSFRRGVNLNAWLMENGYLALKDGANPSEPWLQSVDWSRTKAYAVGLVGIFLNIKGREANRQRRSGDHRPRPYRPDPLRDQAVGTHGRHADRRQRSLQTKLKGETIMFGFTKVKLEKSLVDRISRFSEIAGYSSPEEFITHALEKELAQLEDADSEEEIKKRLQGLGYMS
ncbi:MAG: alkaline phosphatase family protein [Acidobacteria bacterium]|nr:alkaline phosphatase family protein [Candidatus Sulfomarinibacter kjeldsenii]